MLCFTDFNNREGKVFMGASLIFVTLINFFVAILAAACKSLIEVMSVLKRKWQILKLEKAKNRRMREAIAK
jgi:hypothetical protein